MESAWLTGATSIEPSARYGGMTAPVADLGFSNPSTQRHHPVAPLSFAAARIALKY
jgi:hypothetical protein